MKLFHITIGTLLVALLAASVVVGLYALRASEGNGLQVLVQFDDAQGLQIDSDVLYGDKIVGRVELVSGGNVTARLAAEHASFLRRDSRFWVQQNLGSAYLCFDTPPDSGPMAVQGQSYRGLAQRPDPTEAMLPPPLPRKLGSRPGWLCDLRVVITLRDGADTVHDQARRSAAAVVGSQGDYLLVLAPSWLFERSGEVVTERARVELAGGENMVANLLEVSGPLCVLSVQGSAWRGSAASLWPDALADGQGLLLSDYQGTGWTAAHKGGGLEFRAALEGGQVALVDGFNLAGYALPKVGERTGARWVPLNGAQTLIDNAREKLK
jgi:hypothetical protein